MYEILRLNYYRENFLENEVTALFGESLQGWLQSSGVNKSLAEVQIWGWATWAHDKKHDEKFIKARRFRNLGFYASVGIIYLISIIIGEARLVTELFHSFLPIVWWSLLLAPVVIFLATVLWIWLGMKELYKHSLVH